MKKRKQTAKKKSARRKTRAVTSPVYAPDRKIPEWTKIVLFARAGARCEFDGCPHYLLEHHVTFTEGNFAQFAHIVAFSNEGPRGFERRPNDIHDIANLMLLCPTCHKLIDDHPQKYSRAALEAYKQNHEKQIFHLTGLRPELKTSVLVVKSRIGQDIVNVPFDHVLEATAPRYPFSKQGLTIDLTQLSTTGKSFTDAACEAIANEVQGFLSAAGEVRHTGHVSLFALAPIPILIFLGSRLSNKVPVDLFQRHRDNERWLWKSSTTPLDYTFARLQQGTSSDKVALLLSLSGTIRLPSLPSHIDKTFTLYQISVAGVNPVPTLLKARADLDGFRVAYQGALAQIVKDHPTAQEIHLFPAVPAPVAVLCGREYLPRVYPALRVYDNDKTRGGFNLELTIHQ